MSKTIPNYCDIELETPHMFNKSILIFIILLIILVYSLIIYINPLNIINIININNSILILCILIFGVILNYFNIVYKLDINILKIILTIIGIIIVYHFIGKYILKIPPIIIVLIIILLLIKYHEKILNKLNKLININIISNIISKISNNIKKIYNENKISFKLLIVTALIIFIVFILPLIYNLIIDNINGSTKILNESIYLNTKKTISMNKFINYNYGISFWYWINPQPPNTSDSYNNYTNIFNYGDKPSIEINPIKNKFRIKYNKNTNDNEIIYESNIILYQRWNNVFINFDGGNMDIFINGELVSSKPNIISNISYDKLVLGEDNGIHGGISKIVYYNKNIDKNTIENNYNNLRNTIY